MTIRERVLAKVPPILKAYPIEKAWLFGALVNGKPHRYSDVDLLIRWQSLA